MFNGVIAVLMTMFLKFHMKLALEGKTTIENLEHNGKPYHSEFDIGPHNNWIQIFGQYPALWAFPIFAGSGKPIGDGIYWPKKTNQKQGGFSESTTRAQSPSPKKVQSSE